MRLIIEVPEKQPGLTISVGVSPDELEFLIDMFRSRVEDGLHDAEALFEEVSLCAKGAGTTDEKLEAVEDAVSAVHSHLALVKVMRSIVVAYDEEVKVMRSIVVAYDEEVSS